MSLSQADSDELPPLDDFIDSDTEVNLNGMDEESDEFDAIALLSQPIFGDSDGDLDIDKGSEDFDSINSLPNVTEETLSMVQSNFQQPGIGGHSKMQNVTFQAVGGGSGIASTSSGNDNSHMSLEQQNADYRFQDMQGQILRVQQQIEQVQLGGSALPAHGFTSPQQTQQSNVRNNIDIQALMNQAGMNRSPLGRSVSMPIRKHQMQGGALSQPAFMIQKPMDQLLEQSAEGSGPRFSNNNMQGSGMNMTQIQQQQAIMANSQGSSGGNTRSNPNAYVGSMNMNQLQTMINTNSMDGNLQSPVNNSLGMMQKSLMDRQRGAAPSPDGSNYSHLSPSHTMRQGMNVMQGNMMQGMNQPFTLDESDRSAINTMQMVGNMQGGMSQVYSMDNSDPNVMNDMSMMTNVNNMNNMNMNNMGNMQGFNQVFNAGMSDRNTIKNMQGFNLDASVRSLPGDLSGMRMNTNMMMMMMQQQQMMNFGDGEAVRRQNSVPSNTSNNLAMMPNPSQDMMMNNADFERAQMQRSFHGQGLISGPAGQQIALGQAPASGLSMERLVERMQRSALSRNLVKQMSGSSVTMTNTSRSLNRSHSGRGVARTNSKTGRSLSRANSGRSVQRTASGRTLESGELPVRRLAQDLKHRIKDPVLSTTVQRGVVRHKSQSAVMGGSNSKVVNIDGKEVGMF